MLPLEQLVYESSVAGDTRGLQKRWTEFLRRFGAETYWITPFSPQLLKQPNSPMPRIAIAHNVPSGWHEYYRDQGFHRHDPIVKTALAGGSVFTGKEALSAYPSPEAKGIVAAAAEFGIPPPKGHVLLSLWFAPGIMLGTTLCLPSADIRLDATTKLVLKTALFVFYARYQELKPAVPRLAEAFHLTPRERDVLHWLALGKTKQEVADLLFVSASCVKRHCENAYSKLGVNNLASAVARAMSQGLIKP
jgi:DNA-binding CsgD family transcriptional regulator